jgi:hypothetical protein
MKKVRRINCLELINPDLLLFVSCAQRIKDTSGAAAGTSGGHSPLVAERPPVVD